MADLSTTIGGVALEKCIMNASGCRCSTYQDLDVLMLSSVGAVVSKSSTLTPRDGHQGSRIYLNDHQASINATGLPNYGYQFYMNYPNRPKPFIQSIHPFTTQELAIMLHDIDRHPGNKLVEINVSCPNVTTTIDIGRYIDTISRLKLHTTTVGLKLPPLYDLAHFDAIADLLLKTKAIKFITCTNTIPNGLEVDFLQEETWIHPRDGLGGIGGMPLKAVALSNVYNFSKRLGHKLDIIGCGGCFSGRDAFEYLLCGAKAVQVGTCLIAEGLGCFDRIEKELIDTLKIKGYEKIEGFRGKIKVAKLW
jgi:dihydroorotate dehydrogenase (fumarate)